VSGKAGRRLVQGSWRAIECERLGHYFHKEHPEIFRFTSSRWVSLKWRYGYFRTFAPERGCELTESQRAALTPDQQKAITYRPLTADQTEVLMKTALDFHARVIAHEQEHRWLTPLLFALLGGVLAFSGAILGAYIKS